MHVPINVKSPNNINKWQMGFNSAFKELIVTKMDYAFLPSKLHASPSEVFGLNTFTINTK
jgi:hypothetical protein